MNSPRSRHWWLWLVPLVLGLGLLLLLASPRMSARLGQVEAVNTWRAERLESATASAGPSWWAVATGIVVVLPLPVLLAVWWRASRPEEPTSAKRSDPPPRPQPDPEHSA